MFDPIHVSVPSDANRWKLFVCNTFLIPPAHSSTQPTCERQKERAAALGKMILKHRPDVILLQEMWGAGYMQLQRALAKGEPEAYDRPQDDGRNDAKRKKSDPDYAERSSRHCPHQSSQGADGCFVMHTTNAKTDPTYPLNVALRSTPLAPPKYVIPLMMRSWWGCEFLDVATQFLSSRGGLYHAHNSNTVAMQGAYLTFVPGQDALRKVGLLPEYPRVLTFNATFFPKHRKSVIVTKAMKISRHDESNVTKTVKKTVGGKTAAPIPVLMFNTHLDPQNLGPKHRIIERQFLELRSFIAEVVENEWKSTNGEHQQKVFTAPFAAIATGDFNAPSHSFLYPRLFEIMEDQNLFDIEIECSPKAHLLGDQIDTDDVDLKVSSATSDLKLSTTASVFKRKVSVKIRSLLSEDSLAVHTYCTNNVTVLYPSDDGRLDHLFEIQSVCVEVPTAADPSLMQMITINLQPVTLTYERVLNDHKGGDALVSDHYPFVAELVVGKYSNSSF